MYAGLKNLYNEFYQLGLVKRDVFLTRQRKIRTLEWSSIEQYIPLGSSFLDIGCGKGHSMSLAMQNRNCIVSGVDPFPDHAGVAPNLNSQDNPFVIKKGVCENLPFENQAFDIVYSSHMLEHTSDYHKSLTEMQRVLKDDGVMIMGVPTATMAFIRLISILLFSSHRNIIELIRWPLRSENWKKQQKISNFIIPPSHGNPSKNIFYDLNDYKIVQWRKRISQYFNIQKEIYPALYSYPDFPKLFATHTRKRYSSSVFFIATKKQG